MRPSSALCGIRGIFPLIRTLAPQAISPPFSLSSLRGLRLAIDATLLVQRLHFADDPHASRHVIGFYRLITSLHQNGVMPIMVFDHPQKRLALKDREQVKRRHKRELDRIRSRLEHERRGRLLELQSHLDALSELRESERRQVGELLDRWRAQSQQVLSEERPSVERQTSVATPSIPKFSEDVPFRSTGSSKPEAVAYSMHTNWLQLEESLRSGGASQSKGQKVLAEAEKQVYQTIANQLRSGEAPHALPPPETPDDISLAATPEAIPSPPSSAHPLSSLNAMHHSLTKTYDRATSPLSASIYQDCANLSSLMSVPVFWTGDGTRTGGGRIHEAEAYAASLVRSGFADLVASEDSDVLLYEAPLLRGLMGGVRTAEGSRGKLEVICGTRARTRLFPRSDLEKLVHTHSSIRLDSTGDAEADSLYDRLTRSLMLDFALLCGTDFNRTIPGIGPKTALRLLKEHGSISTILRRESKKFAPPDGLSIREYETELRHARMVFLQPPKVRAAARSILGSGAATEAATTREGLSESVERVLFGENPSGVEEAGMVENVDDVSGGGVDAVVNTYCTAEPAVEQELSSVATDAEAIVSVPLEPVTTTSTMPTTTVTYDRQRVHDFLRSHGVFRTPHAHADWALDTRNHTEPREQEWRDLLDLELGLSSPPTPPLTADMNGILEPEDTDETSRLGMATLGADFFGERKAVACWQPHMEQQVRQGTNGAQRSHVES